MYNKEEKIKINQESMNMSSNQQAPGIKKLMSAVIWQSIVDYVNFEDTDSTYISAKLWLFSNSFNNNFSFRRLCENLDYEYKPLREVAQKLRNCGIRIRQNGCQLVNLSLEVKEKSPV